MSNSKAHAFNTQMDAQARIRQLEEQLRERDEMIVNLQRQLTAREPKAAAPALPSTDA